MNVKPNKTHDYGTKKKEVKKKYLEKCLTKENKIFTFLAFLPGTQLAEILAKRLANLCPLSLPGDLLYVLSLRPGIQQRSLFDFANQLIHINYLIGVRTCVNNGHVATVGHDNATLPRGKTAHLNTTAATSSHALVKKQTTLQNANSVTNYQKNYIFSLFSLSL